MIELYTWKTPNGKKPSILLEELGLTYEIHSINISKGEQKAESFLQISPNGKIPAIVDIDERGDRLAVFESGAILQYLTEKTNSPLGGQTLAERAKINQWLHWQMGGIGPNFGQLYHFVQAEEKIPYAIDRFTDESRRLLTVMEDQLSQHTHLAGPDYSIADIATYPWIKAMEGVFKRRNLINLGDFPHLQTYMVSLGQRPAVKKGMAILENNSL
ncbi:MAG: glutathione S-transferase N-terminal domain-containing protein [Pseudomonadota bacterium]